MNIALDVTTLSFMSAVMFLILTLLLWILWYGHRDEPATLYWASSYSAAFLALLLVMLRGRVPDILSIVTANSMAMLCYCLSWWANDLFFGRKPKYILSIGLLILFVAANLYFTVVDHDVRVRVAVYSATATALALTNAYVVTRRPEIGMRLLQMLVATAYVVLAGFNVARFYATMRQSQGVPLFENSVLNMLNFMLPAACCCISAFAWSLMVNQRLRQRLAETVRLDSLTRLLNRQALDDTAAQEISRCLRHQKPLSLLKLDVDHFKQFNDQHGHIQGDILLRRVVDTVRPHLRREDHFARSGGDAFSVLLPETPAEGAYLLAERIRQAVDKMTVTLEDGVILRGTTSIGIATLDEQNRDLDWERLATRAEAALYEAKRRGRNRVVAASGDAGLTLSATL
jgi:diguanylate cyclase (GGDEF)-like protein